MIKTGDNADVINFKAPMKMALYFLFSMQFVVNKGVDHTVHETYFDK